MDTFGFAVGRERVPGRQPFDRTLPPEPHRELWRVTLPHQCGDWTPTGDYGDEDVYVDHDVAVKRFEAFIAEAQSALTALKGQQEFGESEESDD